MPAIYGDLKAASLESLSSNPSSSTAGRIWRNSTDGQIYVDDGTNKRALFRNDNLFVFGTNATAANNVRFHRAGSGILQFVLGSDSTAEGSVATNLAQISARVENSTSSTKPSAGASGRLLFLTDSKIVVVDDGTAFKTVGAAGGITSVGATKTSAYTAQDTDSFIPCSASGGAFTLTLPAASTRSAFQLTIMKTDSSTNKVTIDANASETLNGQLTLTLNSQYEMVSILCDGSNWVITDYRGPNAFYGANSAGSIVYNGGSPGWGTLNSQALEPGVYNFTAQCGFFQNGAGTLGNMGLGFSTTTNTITGTEGLNYSFSEKSGTNGQRNTIAVSYGGVSVTATTTYYLVSLADTSTNVKFAWSWKINKVALA